MPHPSSIRGFTLLEALIALGLLALILLGGLTMLLDGLRTGREALHRSTAATLAADLAERVRANVEAGAAYDTDPDDVDLELQGPSCTGLAPCDVAARATNDLTEWQHRLAQTLPAGRGQVRSAPSGAVTSYVIEVRWAVSGSDAVQSYRLLVLR